MIQRKVRDKMSKITTPSTMDKHEIAGRMYETVDLIRAIEEGSVESVADILTLMNESAETLSQLLKCEKWILNENSCVDVQASIDLRINEHS